MDPTVQEVIDEIINNPPMAANSIALDFAPEEVDCNILDVFDFLLIFLSQLCKKMYPTSGKIDLAMMTDENIYQINRYMHSIGFQLEVDKIPFKNELVDEIQKNRYDKIVITPGTKINKLYMPLASASMIYLIRFDFYRGGC